MCVCVCECECECECVCGHEVKPGGDRLGAADVHCQCWSCEADNIEDV